MVAHDRDMFKLIDVEAARQKWIDQGQSFNIYNKETSMLYMDKVVKAAWSRGQRPLITEENAAASEDRKTTVAETMVPKHAVRQTCRGEIM